MVAELGHNVLAFVAHREVSRIILGNAQGFFRARPVIDERLDRNPGRKINHTANVVAVIVCSY